MGVNPPRLPIMDRFGSEGTGPRKSLHDEKAVAIAATNPKSATDRTT
jgi:hypothetical protein